MREDTIQQIISAKDKQLDFFLIDRGVLDSVFHDWKYYENEIELKNARKIANQKIEKMNLKPKLVMVFTIPAEESIRRRGGEGRIVTKEYVNNFNKNLTNFLNEVKEPIREISTLGKTREEVTEIVVNELLEEYINTT